MKLGLKNGLYKVQATVSDHADLLDSKLNMNCQNNKCTAILQIKSDKYEKISVDKKIYKKMFEEGDSTFEVLVKAFDVDMEVELIDSDDKDGEPVTFNLSLDSKSLKLEKAVSDTIDKVKDK